MRFSDLVCSGHSLWKLRLPDIIADPNTKSYYGRPISIGCFQPPLFSKGAVTMRGKVRRFVTGSVITVGLFLPRALPAAGLSRDSEPSVVAERVWNSLLAHCASGSYFYAGSSLDGDGMLSDVQVGKNPVLEFRGVTFHLVPVRVTDAERANGVEFRGRATMVAHLYREGGGSWQDGPDLQRRNMDDMVGRVLADSLGEFFGMGGGGSMALQIVKYKGVWALARSSTDFSSGFGAGGQFQLIDQFVKGVPHYDCGAGTIASRPLKSASAGSASATGQ